MTGVQTCALPISRDRNKIRNKLKEDFIEIFVDCNLEECEKKDPKGLYKKARAGEIKHFTGIEDPYEIPLNPELTIDSANKSVNECVEIIMKYIKNKNII